MTQESDKAQYSCPLSAKYETYTSRIDNESASLTSSNLHTAAAVGLAPLPEAPATATESVATEAGGRSSFRELVKLVLLLVRLVGRHRQLSLLLGF
jgi:hypothetical protein